MALDTDACPQQGIFVVVQETPDGQERPWGHWLRLLTAEHEKYVTTHKECLAVVRAVALLKSYLAGPRFTKNGSQHMTVNTEPDRCNRHAGKVEPAVIQTGIPSSTLSQDEG